MAREQLDVHVATSSLSIYFCALVWDTIRTSFRRISATFDTDAVMVQTAQKNAHFLGARLDRKRKQFLSEEMQRKTLSAQMRAADGDIDLVDLILALWSQKLLIAGFAVLFAVTAAAFAWTRPVAHEVRVAIMVEPDVIPEGDSLLRSIAFAVGPTWTVTEVAAGPIPYYATTRVADPADTDARLTELTQAVDAFEKEWIELARMRLRYFNTEMPEGVRESVSVSYMHFLFLDRVKLAEAGVDLVSVLPPGASGFGGVRSVGFSHGPTIAGGGVIGFLLGCVVALFRRAVLSRRAAAA